MISGYFQFSLPLNWTFHHIASSYFISSTWTKLRHFNTFPYLPDLLLSVKLSLPSLKWGRALMLSAIPWQIFPALPLHKYSCPPLYPILGLISAPSVRWRLIHAHCSGLLVKRNSHDNDVCAPHPFPFISRTFKVGSRASQNYNVNRKKLNVTHNFLSIHSGNHLEYCLASQPSSS